MRRVFLLLLAAALLSGCGGEGAAGAPAPFSAPCQLTADCAGSFEGSVRFCWRGPGSCTLEYLAPAALAGMTLTREGDSVTVDFMGLSDTAALSSLPPSSPLRLLADAAELCCRAEPALRDGEELYEADGVSVRCLRGVPRAVEAAGRRISLTVTGYEETPAA